jgi:hypothetical protein
VFHIGYDIAVGNVIPAAQRLQVLMLLMYALHCLLRSISSTDMQQHILYTYVSLCCLQVFSVMPGADSEWDWRREQAITALINEADIDVGTSTITTGNSNSSSSGGGGSTLIDAPFTAFWRDNCVVYVDMYRCV